MDSNIRLTARQLCNITHADLNPPCLQQWMVTQLRKQHLKQDTVDFIHHLATLNATQRNKYCVWDNTVYEMPAHKKFYQWTKNTRSWRVSTIKY